VHISDSENAMQHGGFLLMMVWISFFVGPGSDCCLSQWVKIRGMVFRMVSRNASNQESLLAVSNNEGSIDPLQVMLFRSTVPLDINAKNKASKTRHLPQSSLNAIPLLVPSAISPFVLGEHDIAF
jgi:hypothetical protein